jgi:radical SAM superfamily enzyme YgiQ (UPF0313 family)
VRKSNGARPSHHEVVTDVQSFLESLESEGLISSGADNRIDVLLVVPPAPSVYHPDATQTPEYSAPPLGICYIASVLRDNGFRISILDLHHTSSLPEAVLASCRKLNPAIVGLTASTPSFPNALAVASFVKAWSKECITVLGGPHATGAPRESVLSGVIDIVCIGEGEIAMLELAEALLRQKGNPKEVPGFCFATPDGTVSFAHSRPRVLNLDDFPFPARDMLDLNSYHQMGSIVSSRGCPIGCNFCACTAIAGQTYRVHSLDYVLREMDHMAKVYGCRHFDFHDDTFNLYPRRVEELCATLQIRNANYHWGCFCRAAQFSPALASAMVNAGCNVIQFGVESGSETVLRSSRKRTSKSQIEAAVRAAASAGIKQVVCGFIIGHATDTPSTIRETIDFGLHLRDLGATRLTLSLLTPYPGTEVYNKRDEFGIHILTNDWEQYTFSRVVIETSRLHREELRQLYVNGLNRFLDATRY